MSKVTVTGWQLINTKTNEVLVEGKSQKAIPAATDLSKVQGGAGSEPLCCYCGEDLKGYYEVYRFIKREYCPHCIQQALVQTGLVQAVSYNEEFAKFKKSLDELEESWL